MGRTIRQKPDVVFNRDNVYGDWSPSNSIYQPASPDHLWMRYAQTRTMLDFYYHKRSFRLTPFGMIAISVATMAGKIINIKRITGNI